MNTRIPDWADAACRTMPVSLWYSNRSFEMQEASTICKRCPIRQVCLDYAIEASEEYGIWGGLTPSQRRRHKRKQIEDRWTAY